jgi:galacturan 1,4-alpha-galacturonidase
MLLIDLTGSIGSLGENGATANVSQVQVKNCVMEGTTNGLRIKTWQVK